MLIKDSPDLFDQLQTDIPSMGRFSQDKSHSRFIQNNELIAGKYITSNSRAAYHLVRAEDSGNVKAIEDYPEPLAYKLKFSKTGFLTKKTVKMTIVRLSILKVLAQGGKPNISDKEHKYELLFSGNTSLVNEMKEAVDEVWGH